MHNAAPGESRRHEASTEFARDILCGQSLPPATPMPAPAKKAEPANEIVIVDTAKGLRKLAGMLAAEPIIGLDTETAFFDPDDRHSKGKLALVQLTLPEQALTVLVDPVKSCDESTQEIRYRDLRALRKALQAATPVKVAHSAGFDKKVLESVGIEIAEMVDTQSLLRQVRPDIRQTSLRIACKYVLGLEVDKEQQTSAWHSRPLSAEQTKYAALDPELALALHGALKAITDRAAWTKCLSMEEAITALDAKLRDLDRTIERDAPELRAWEAKEAALMETLRKRHPGGTPGYSGPDGSVYPGEPLQEVDGQALRAHLAELPLTRKQRGIVERELESATSAETSKGRIVAALKAAGGKSLGFASIAELERFVDGFRTARGPAKIHIEPAYQAVEADPPPIHASASDDDLMADLATVSRTILETLRDRAPEIPAARYECKAILSRIADLANETGIGVECNAGRVRIEAGTPAVDPERLRVDLPVRLAGYMAPEAVEAMIDSTFTRKIAKAALTEMLRKPELAFLTDDHDRESALWKAALVGTNRHSATRVVPRL